MPPEFLIVELGDQSGRAPSRGASALEIRKYFCVHAVGHGRPGWPSRRSLRGVRGVRAVNSRFTNRAFARGSASITDVASATSLQPRKKTTPLPSAREYHCRILPSRYRRTVARISSGITLMTFSRSTPGFIVSITRTSVAGAGAAGDCGYSGEIRIKPTANRERALILDCCI